MDEVEFDWSFDLILIYHLKCFICILNDIVRFVRASLYPLPFSCLLVLTKLEWKVAGIWSFEIIWRGA